MRPFDLLIHEQHGQLKEFIKRLIDVPNPGSPEHKMKLATS